MTQMQKHSHEFVETYKGMVGFGLTREIDENTVICYLQKISDDQLVKKIIKRLSNDELDDIFSFLSRLLKKHLTESEYHKLFLKE